MNRAQRRILASMARRGLALRCRCGAPIWDDVICCDACFKSWGETEEAKDLRHAYSVADQAVRAGLRRWLGLPDLDGQEVRRAG